MQKAGVSKRGWQSGQVVKIPAVAHAHRSHVATPTPVVSVTRLGPSSIVDFLVKLAAEPLSHRDELGRFQGALYTKCLLDVRTDLSRGIPVNPAGWPGSQAIEQIIDSSKAGLHVVPARWFVPGAQQRQTEIEGCEGIIFVLRQGIFECPSSFRVISYFVVR